MGIIEVMDIEIFRGMHNNLEINKDKLKYRGINYRTNVWNYNILIKYYYKIINK